MAGEGSGDQAVVAMGAPARSTSRRLLQAVTWRQAGNGVSCGDGAVPQAVVFDVRPDLL
eukprot:COSAG02_NODE_1162_length_14168_cov_10.478570_2_plen_59_part_00